MSASPRRTSTAAVATLVTSVVLGVALFAETLGRGATGMAFAVPGLVLMAAGILALSTGDSAPEVMPGVATAAVDVLRGDALTGEPLTGEAS